MSYRMRWISTSTFVLCAVLVAGYAAGNGPKSIPPTRPEIKQALEVLKQRKPRLEVPPATAEEIARNEGHPPVSNGRARAYFLPEEWLAPERASGASSREPNDEMQLDYGFGVALFWISSRGNNCHYCLGHQELKLAKAGWEDDRIAALDCDWQQFDEKTKPALALARKLTLEPQNITDADIDALRPHFTDRQIVEMVHLIARYNATNRWTDSLGLPQDRSFRDRPAKLDTPTSPEYQQTVSVVLTAAPMRAALESRSEVEEQLVACRARSPRVALLEQAEAEKALPEVAPGEPQTNWVRALATMPKLAAGKLGAMNALDAYGEIERPLKAQLAWATARQNRAWYALGHARAKLQELGFSDDQIFALDKPNDTMPAATREALVFAQKLTATPQLIEDADIERLRQHYSDRQVAQIVYVICSANYFDRLTEALNLPLEG